MLLYRQSDRPKLLLSVVTGDFDLEQALEEVDRVYRSGFAREDQDRALFIMSDFDLESIPVADIYEFREALMRRERAVARTRAFKYAVVVEGGRPAPAMETYMALRRTGYTPAPDMRVTASVPAAELFLGVRGLRAAFAPLIAEARARIAADRDDGDCLSGPR